MILKLSADQQLLCTYHVTIPFSQSLKSKHRFFVCFFIWNSLRCMYYVISWKGRLSSEFYNALNWVYVCLVKKAIDCRRLKISFYSALYSHFSLQACHFLFIPLYKFICLEFKPTASDIWIINHKQSDFDFFFCCVDLIWVIY